MRAVLLLQCPDRPGIVAAVGAFVAEHRRQRRRGRPALRPRRRAVPAARRVRRRRDRSPRCDAGFAPIARAFAMDWSLHDLATRPRVAVLASRQGHCLADLLVRNALGELAGEFVLVASNHDTHAALVERFGVPFRHLPVADDSAGGARRAGARARRAARRDRARRRRARPLHARAPGVARRDAGTSG